MEVLKFKFDFFFHTTMFLLHSNSAWSSGGVPTLQTCDLKKHGSCLVSVLLEEVMLRDADLRMLNFQAVSGSFVPVTGD